MTETPQNKQWISVPLVLRRFMLQRQTQPLACLTCFTCPNCCTVRALVEMFQSQWETTRNLEGNVRLEGHSSAKHRTSAWLTKRTDGFSPLVASLLQFLQTFIFPCHFISQCINQRPAMWEVWPNDAKCVYQYYKLDFAGGQTKLSPSYPSANKLTKGL